MLEVLHCDSIQHAASTRPDPLRRKRHTSSSILVVPQIRQTAAVCVLYSGPRALERVNTISLSAPTEPSNPTTGLCGTLGLRPAATSGALYPGA